MMWPDRSTPRWSFFQARLPLPQCFAAAHSCPSRIRLWAATGNWTRLRQWEIHRTLCRFAVVTVCPPATVNGVRPFTDAWERAALAVHLEVGKLAFEVTGIPEQYVVEEFSPHRPDQALHNGCERGTCGTVLSSAISKIRRFAIHWCASYTGS
jgi:hypothetical protein